MSLTEREITQLRESATDSMLDGCQIGTYDDTKRGSTGQVLSDYDWSDVIPCGYKPMANTMSGEFTNENGDVVHAEGRLRLPHGTVIDHKSKVRIVSRAGQDVDPIEYDVLGLPAVGLTATVAYIRKTSH